MKQIILASGSPRRKELLRQIGLTFKVIPSRFKEDMGLKMKPAALARFLSLGKAEEVAARYPHALVIAADTFIVYKDRVIGKPRNASAARRMLRLFSGGTHSVMTGYAMIDGGTKFRLTRSVETKVFFRKLSGREINAYIDLRKPYDLAGAYAIQELGGIFVKKIEGDYYNIVGLPIAALTEDLKRFGIKVL